MPKNILVTGGAGFIGSHLVDALVAKGHNVRVIDSLVPQVHGDRKPRWLNPAVDYVFGDVCDADVLAKGLEKMDIVFHQAAEVGVGQSMYEMQRYVRANTLGTAALLEAIVARKDQIKKVIVASSMSIYGEGAYACEKCGAQAPELRTNEQLAAQDWEVHCPKCQSVLRARGTDESKPLFPTSVYAVTKQDQEQLCLSIGRAYNIPTVALRYFNVYGDRQALSNPYTGVCAIFSARLLNGKAPIIFEDGKQSRDFIHVSDIVQANLLAMGKSAADFQSLNIGTGASTSILQVAEMLAQGLGVTITGVTEGQYRKGDIRHCVSDISRARKLLGYEPKVQLRDGIKGLLDWVRGETAADRVEQATEELRSRQLVQ